MYADCAECGESNEYRGSRPRYCGFCGKTLDELSTTTVVGMRGDATVAHHPIWGGGAEVTGPHAMPERVGGYRMIRELGRGGMGTVYEAEETEHGRRVALKLLSHEISASPDALERFRQEGRLASTMAHPRCVFVLNADEDEGRPFIVMELMPGSTLADLVNAEGPLPIRRAVPKILDVIEGLREAHRLGLIHRDVKPSNCFMEADGRVKVGDFGLSKSLVADSNLTRTGSFLGTPLYASPEQIKGEVLDPRTDVYSVAATLYYLLAGRAPFQGSDAASTLAKIVSEPPRPIRALRPDLPAELERIIHRGLERNRERRYRDLGELAEALLPFAPGRLRIGGLGLRAAALLMEVFLTKWVIIALVNVIVALASRGVKSPSFTEEYMLSAALDLAIFGIAYFLVEPIWGASPAKLLLGLRIKGAGGETPEPRTILARNLIFWAAASLSWQVLALALGATGHSGWLGLALPLRLACLAAVVSTMRTSNGYAGLHDQATSTRVVMLPRMKVRKAAGARRAIGRDRGVVARPVGVMKAIGPFKVRGAVRWEEGRKVLAAEDSSLGREVWIVMRPKQSPAPEPNRRELTRATRPRWLFGGEQTEGRWDAFIAPAGCPLADLAGPEGLPWRDARPLLEDLVEELHAAARDGTLPDGLTTEQLWVQPDGRAMLVDPLATPPPADGDPDLAFERACGFVRDVAALALMGGRLGRKGKGKIRAALPRHAWAILDRLPPGPAAFPDFDALQHELAETQDRPVEVTRSARAVQVAASSALLALAMLLVFGVTLLVLSGYLVEYGIPTPSGKMIVFSPREARNGALIVLGAVGGLLVATSAATRGGLVLPMLGCCLTTEAGKPAGRWRCAWRSLLVWGTPTAILAGAVMAQGPGRGANATAWTLLATSMILVAAYIPLAIGWPARGPHDRLAGTVLVPK